MARTDILLDTAKSIVSYEVYSLILIITFQKLAQSSIKTGQQKLSWKGCAGLDRLKKNLMKLNLFDKIE